MTFKEIATHFNVYLIKSFHGSRWCNFIECNNAQAINIFFFVVYLLPGSFLPYKQALQILFEKILDIIMIWFINHVNLMNFGKQVVVLKDDCCIIFFVSDYLVIYVMKLSLYLVILVEVLEAKDIFFVHVSLF